MEVAPKLTEHRRYFEALFAGHAFLQWNRAAEQVFGFPEIFIAPARGEEKTIRLRFTPGDITWLTREIRAKRRNFSGVPNVFSTSEFLRIVGHYMDIQRTFLVGLSRNDQFLTLNYETRQGERVLATHPVSFFDDLFIRMCLKRKLPSDPRVILRSDP